MNLKPYMDAYGKALVAEIKKNIKEKNKIASRNLYQSLRYQVIESDDKYEIQIVSLSYLGNVDSGRKPGKMPPVDSIEKWLKDKKIKQKQNTSQIKGLKSRGLKTQRQLAWAIAISIGKKGIKPSNVVSDAIDNLLPQLIVKITNDGNEQLTKIIETQFQQIFNKQVNIIKI